MKSEKLFTKGEIFQDEFLTGAQSPDSPADEVPEREEHGRNLTRTPTTKPVPAHFKSARRFDEEQPEGKKGG